MDNKYYNKPINMDDIEEAKKVDVSNTKETIKDILNEKAKEVFDEAISDESTTDLLEMLKNAFISGTGVPASLNESEFAKESDDSEPSALKYLLDALKNGDNEKSKRIFDEATSEDSKETKILCKDAPSITDRLKAESISDKMRDLINKKKSWDKTSFFRGVTPEEYETLSSSIMINKNPKSIIKERPKVIAIVGSSKLKDNILLYARCLETNGYITLMSHLFSHVDDYELSKEELRKATENGENRIDMCDEVHCLASDHIGYHTLEELSYATSRNKPIKIIKVFSTADVPESE